MMNLSKQFSMREKVLLAVLAALWLIAVYFFAVYRPVAQAMTEVEDQRQQLELDITVLTAQEERMEQMRQEVEAVLADPDPAQVPPYNNLQQVMGFLNAVLAGTSDYSLNFQTMEQPEEGQIVRRPVEMTFTCASYQAACAVVEQLQDCPYLCQVDRLDLSPTRQRQSNATPPVLTEGTVAVTVEVTFFESLS